MCVLLLSEQGGEDRPSGVVHSSHQRQVGSSALQPVVPAAVNLQQHPLPRVALPSAVAPGGPPASRTPHSLCQQYPPDGGTRQVDALPLGQHLGQMGVVEASVEALGQLPDCLHCLRRRGRHRLPPPVPVSHGSCSLLPVRCQQSPCVALAHSHQPGRNSHRHLSLQHSVQHLCPPLLLGCQSQSFHGLRFSLNS